MKDDQKYLFFALAAAALLAFLLGRRKGIDKGQNDINLPPSVGDCVSAINTDAQAAIAKDIRSVYENMWVMEDSDYEKIKTALRRIPDACAARGVYAFFGDYRPALSWIYGGGDLDYWFSHAPEKYKNEFRKLLFNVGTF